MYELTALLIGFTGSFHCVAMCGPIALALSGGNENTRRYLTGRAVYNSGRLVTYAILGFLAGAAGHTLMIAGLQKSISIGVGLLMILSVTVIHYLPGFTKAGTFTTRINLFVRKVFNKVLKQRNTVSMFTSGMANGILPCGFVYLAMAGAATTQSPSGGMLYMALFGLGTFPAMMAVAAFGKIAGLKARGFLNKAAPILMIALGLFFIFRGITLKDNSCCHHVNPIASAAPGF